MARESLKRRLIPSGVYWSTAPGLVAQHPGSGRLLAKALKQIERAEALPLRGDLHVMPETYGVARKYCVHRLGRFSLWLWYAERHVSVVLYALRDVPPLLRQLIRDAAGRKTPVRIRGAAKTPS
jgi:hypothetical protein